MSKKLPKKLIEQSTEVYSLRAEVLPPNMSYVVRVRELTPSVSLAVNEEVYTAQKIKFLSDNSNNPQIQQMQLVLKVIDVRNSLNALSEQIKTLDVTSKQKLYEEVLKNKGLIDPEEYNRYIVYEETLNTLLDMVKKAGRFSTIGELKSKGCLSYSQLDALITGLLHTGELVQFEYRNSTVLATLENYKKYYKGQPPILYLW